MIPPNSNNQPIVIKSQVGWSSILISSLFTVASVASAFTVGILYIRPILLSMDEATKNADKAAKEMDIAAQDIQKTMALIDQETPLTLQEIRKASEEFELLGKQLNYLLGVVVRPVEPVGKAAEWVQSTAESTTLNLSKRLAQDTASLANVSY